jgi:hypothetical protein
MTKTKKSSLSSIMSIGSRVRHTSDPTLIEGVVVWRHSYTKAIGPRDVDGREWSVHWSNGNRGIYRTNDISKIPPKNMKVIILSDIEKENEEVHAEE